MNRRPASLTKIPPENHSENVELPSGCVSPGAHHASAIRSTSAPIRTAASSAAPQLPGGAMESRLDPGTPNALRNKSFRSKPPAAIRTPRSARMRRSPPGVLIAAPVTPPLKRINSSQRALTHSCTFGSFSSASRKRPINACPAAQLFRRILGAAIGGQRRAQQTHVAHQADRPETGAGMMWRPLGRACAAAPK